MKILSLLSTISAFSVRKIKPPKSDLECTHSIIKTRDSTIDAALDSILKNEKTCSICNQTKRIFNKIASMDDLKEYVLKSKVNLDI